MNFSDWAMQELSSLPNTKEAYLYKQKVVAKMTERANELVATGLKDNDVINGLLIDEFKNIKKGFYNKQYEKNEVKRKARKFNLTVLGWAAYALALVTVFLFVSFTTHLWSKTWLILIAGILLPSAGNCIYWAIKIIKKSILSKLVSRLLIASSVITVGTTAFFLVAFLTDVSKPWLILIAIAPLCLLADMIASLALKQKTAIFFCMLYIPAIVSLLYLILALIPVITWHPYWLMIVFSLVIDILIAFFSILKNTKTKEIDAPWEEN